MEHRRWPRMRRATRRAVIFSACKVLSGYGDGDDLPRWHRTGESFSEAFSSREISRRRFVSFLSSIFIYRRQIIVERVYIYYDHWLDYIIYTHVRFFDGIFEIKFCSFGFLSFFFSTFIIDIYNARIRPVFKVELLNRQSDSFWTTMYTCILSCTQNKER